MSVLEQDHFAYDNFTVIETVLRGNKKLFEIKEEMDALYAKEDFSDAKVELTGDIASINTANEMRDNHLKSADFFDTENTNELVFEFKMKFPFLFTHGHPWGDLREIQKQMKLIDLSVDVSDLQKITEYVIQSRQKEN
mgnify:CR=1 FL=1